MSFVAIALSIFASLLILSSALAFLKAKDFFGMTHIVIIANLYAVPLLLIGTEIEKFSWVSCAKVVTLILLNFVVVNLLCHAILRRAMINKVAPDVE